MNERLTKRTDNGYVPQYERETKHNYYDLVSKLGQHEDIEDKIKFPLKKAFECLEKGVYMLTKHFDIVYCKCPKIVHYKSGWKILIYGAILSLTTYGKKWALTKEELKQWKN